MKGTENNMKRLIALVLTVIMLLGVLPMGVFAAETATGLVYENEIYTDTELAKYKQYETMCQMMKQMGGKGGKKGKRKMMLPGLGGKGGFPGGGGRPRGGTSTAASTDIPTLTFSGGYTVINAGGDGIDSNGNIVITGGTVIVYGPTDSGNGPIDSGDGNYSVTISGGFLLAVGSSGMAETAENAGQAVLAASWRSGGLSAGETLGIVDEDGNVLAAFELPKAIQSIVFSSPDLVAGKSYSVVGGGSTSAPITDGVIDPTTYTGYESMGEIQAS